MGNIRFLLALAVVFAHAWTGGSLMVGGRNAVQLFYMISGFLISFVLLESKNYQRPRDFYLNRALRLYPTYYVVAALSLVAYLLVDTGFSRVYQDLPETGAISLIFANLAIVGQDWIMFTGADTNHFFLSNHFQNSPIPVWQGLLVPPAWSLGVEITFYLLAPFILTRRKLIYLLMASSLCLRAWLIKQGIGQQDPWTYRFFPTELFFFLAGALSHQLLLPKIKKWTQPVQASTARIATLSFIALIVAFSFIPLPFGVKSVFLLASFFVVLPMSFLYQCSTRFDRTIGELSYPLYICHYLVVELAFFWLNQHSIVNSFPIALVITVISVVFAFGLNELVGKRVEHLRNRFRRHAPARVIADTSGN